MRFLSSALLLTASVSLSPAHAKPNGRPSLKNALYKNPKAPVDSRVADLLSRMTIEEKTSQLLQGDIRNWLNDQTGVFNETGLAWSTQARGGSFYVGIAAPLEWISEGTRKAQEYIQKNTYLGIPAFVQTEGIHGFLACKPGFPNQSFGTRPRY